MWVTKWGSSPGHCSPGILSPLTILSHCYRQIYIVLAQRGDIEVTCRHGTSSLVKEGLWLEGKLSVPCSLPWKGRYVCFYSASPAPSELRRELLPGSPGKASHPEQCPCPEVNALVMSYLSTILGYYQNQTLFIFQANVLSCTQPSGI